MSLSLSRRQDHRNGDAISPHTLGKKALTLSLEAKRILPEHPVTFVTRGQKHWAVNLFFHSKGGDKGSGSESSGARLR